MKPGFALNFDDAGVSLLFRTDAGWISVGRAGFDDDELDATLTDLRARAEELTPGQVATKLILPASQILYMDVEAPGPDRASRRGQISAALEGRTPYAVDDLAFDWSRTGTNVSVAVVAKLTLEEAEDFAESRGFNPVSFVALPDAAQFAGEPFFGPTSTSDDHLPEGARLLRDQDPVRVIDAPLPVTAATKPEETAEVEAPAPADAPEAADATETAASGDTEKTADTADEEPGADADDGSDVESGPAALKDDTATVTEAGIPQEADQPDSEADGEDTAADAAAAHEDDTPDADAPETPPLPARVPTPAATPNITAARAPDECDETTKPDTESDSSDFARQAASSHVATLQPADAEAPFIAVDDLPELEAGGAMDDPVPAFSSRRIDASDLADPIDAPVSGRLHFTDVDELEPPRPAPKLGAAVAEAGITAPSLAVPSVGRADAKALGGVTAAPSVSVGKALLNTPPERPRETLAQREAKRLTKPGQTEPGAFGTLAASPSAAPDRRRLGLILVAALVLVMAAVALLSLWFSGQPDTPASTAVDPPEIETVNATAVEPEPQQPAVTAPEPVPEVVTAPEAVIEEGPAAPAEETLWTDAPENVPGAEADASGAPLIAPAAPAPDGTAATSPLPDQTAVVTDAAPPPYPLPPPFGTQFEYLPDGSIRPTPDGVITPDGFTLYSGQPPIVPAPRPGDISSEFAPGTIVPETGTDAAAETVTEIAEPATEEPSAIADAPVDQSAPLPEPADPAHAALKPRTRPETIVAAAQAAEAEAAALAEAAAAAEKALAEASNFAVASSQRPASKPSGFAKAVESAIASAVAESITVTAPAAAPEPAPAPAPAPAATVAAAPPPEEIDEPEPVAAAPNIPTSVTVAKQATVKNAINLRKMNLIGVYGSSSSRRALIRMPTGRYIKVKVGDRLDGGKVAAIGDSELRYVKNGRNYVLKILKNG